MTITPVSAMGYMAPGSKLEGVEGVITKVFPERKAGTNAHGEYSFQNATFRDSAGHDIPFKFDGFPLIEPNWSGVPVRIVASTDSKAKSLTVEEYNGKKRLVVRSTATFEWNPPGLSAPAAAAAGGPPGPQQPAPQEKRWSPPPQQGPPAHSAPPAQSSPSPQAPPPAQGSAPPAKKLDGNPVYGATVGMAIKEACGMLRGVTGEMEEAYLFGPQFSQDLYEVASDILRVSHLLEKGKLAPSVKTRMAGQNQPPAAQQTPPPPAPPPPPQQHYEEPHHNPSGPQFSDDDIPF